MNPCIAIIDANTLGRTALRNLLTDIYGSVEIHLYGNMDEFIRDSNRHFVHFFVSSDILFTCVEEFEMLKSKTIVTSIGPDKSLQTAGFRVMDISLPENELKAHLLQLHSIEYGNSKGRQKNRPGRKRAEDLSSREKDVLALMVKGLINKEIAEKLDISTTTVIFHRNNICLKLGTRSIGKLTVYAVLSGIVSINEI